MIQRMFVAVDTKKTNYKNVGKINHGDDLILELTVLSDGDMISFNDPMVDLLVKKSDGKMIRQNSGIEQTEPNKFIIEVSKDCVTSPGLTTNQLIINDNGRISTCMFYYTILNSLEEDIIQSISNVEVLEQLDEFVIQIKDKMEIFDDELLNKISDFEDAIEDLEEFFGDTSVGLLEAELSRNEAEQSRAQAESVRVQNETRRLQNDLDLANAEAERVRAENIRIQNEVDRALVDAVMDQKESERENSELERIQNESKRATDEVARQQNENTRQSNESIRMSNETDRKTQENRRATAETNRVNAETTRRNNENSRISNETERQKTMNELKSLINNVNGVIDERVGVIEDEIDEINSSLDNLESEVNELKKGNIEIDLTNYVTKNELSTKADKTELHSHTNKSVLDSITTSKVNQWDNIVNEFNDHITNHPSGGIDERIGVIEDEIDEINSSLDNLESEVNETIGGVVEDLSDIIIEINNINSSLDNIENRITNLESNGGGSGSSLNLRDVADGETFTIDGVVTPTITYGQIVLSKTSTTITEGGVDTFTVKLDQKPTNNQVVNISKNNSDVTLSATSLTFTPSNYSTAQTVTITVAQDDTDYSNETCVITCSSNNVSSKTLTVTITDNDTAPSNIPVTGVALDKTSYNLKVGETVQLTPTITPSNATNKNVIWTFSNGNCTVTDGLVTGVAVGDCIITCTTVNGSYTVSCSIVITSADVEPPINIPTDDLPQAYKEDGCIYVNPLTLGSSLFTLRTGDDTEHVYFSLSQIPISKTPVANLNLFNGFIEDCGEYSFNGFINGEVSGSDYSYVYVNGSYVLRVPMTDYNLNEQDILKTLHYKFKRLPIRYNENLKETIITDEIIDKLKSINGTSTNDTHINGFVMMENALDTNPPNVFINSLSGYTTNNETPTADKEVWWVNATYRLNYKIPISKLNVNTLDALKNYLKQNRLIFWYE